MFLYNHTIAINCHFSLFIFYETKKLYLHLVEINEITILVLCNFNTQILTTLLKNLNYWKDIII